MAIRKAPDFVNKYIIFGDASGQIYRQPLVRLTVCRKDVPSAVPTVIEAITGRYVTGHWSAYWYGIEHLIYVFGNGYKPAAADER